MPAGSLLSRRADGRALLAALRAASPGGSAVIAATAGLAEFGV